VAGEGNVEGHGVGSIRAPAPRVCDKDKAGISAAAAADRRRRRGGRSGLGFGGGSASAPLGLVCFPLFSSVSELGMAAGAVGFGLKIRDSRWAFVRWGVGPPGQRDMRTTRAAFRFMEMEAGDCLFMRVI